MQFDFTQVNPTFVVAVIGVIGVALSALISNRLTRSNNDSAWFREKQAETFLLAMKYLYYSQQAQNVFRMQLMLPDHKIKVPPKPTIKRGEIDAAIRLYAHKRIQYSWAAASRRFHLLMVAREEISDAQHDGTEELDLTDLNFAFNAYLKAIADFEREANKEIRGRTIPERLTDWIGR